MCVFSKKKIGVELHYVKKRKESNFVLELVVLIEKKKKKRQTNVDKEIYGRLNKTTLRTEFCASE